MFPESWGLGMGTVAMFRAGHSTVTRSQHTDWVWVTAVVAAQCEVKLLLPELTVTLTYKPKHKYLEGNLIVTTYPSRKTTLASLLRLEIFPTRDSWTGLQYLQLKIQLEKYYLPLYSHASFVSVGIFYLTGWHCNSQSSQLSNIIEDISTQ